MQMTAKNVPNLLHEGVRGVNEVRYVLLGGGLQTQLTITVLGTVAEHQP